MTQQSKCENCEKSGLAILPVRYAVMPKTARVKLPAGIVGAGMTDISLSEHQYALRTLREGWLFVFYELGVRGRNYWQAYRVTPDGRLWKQDLPLPRVPRTDPACAKKSIAVQMDLLAIEHPHKCGKVWIAFSEHAWHAETFKQYAASAALRAQRMQMIEPAQWIQSGADASGHAVLATQESIDDVVEYMPGFDPKLLSPRPDEVSEESGGYHKALLAREATRYPLAIRQATPDSASTELVKLMRAVGETAEGKSHPPMLLALWDGIGAVHELNGFRNDAASMLQLYVRERAAQVAAMQLIGEAEVAVRHGAVASKSRMRLALQAGWEALKQNPYAADGAIPLVALASPAEQAAAERRIEAAANISPAEAQRLGHDAWEGYRRNLAVKHGVLLVDRFRQRFTDLQRDIAELQAKRTPDVKAWLQAPLFLATLHDYGETNIADGVAFDAVIAEAITGLGSEDTGATVLADLVKQTDPTQSASLVWRAFAYNQIDAKAEIKELLGRVSAYRAPFVSGFDEWAQKVGNALDKMKAFPELREKIGEVNEHENPISATERVLKQHGVDRWVVTMGDALFKWTGIDKTGDFAGEYLIRGALMMRVGISKDDTVKLVREAVRIEPALRVKFEQGYRAFRQQNVPAKDAFMRSMQDLAEDRGGQLLREQWNAVRITAGGDTAAAGIRLGGVLAIIELFCFAAAAAKLDKNGEDYALMTASGFSVVSACLIAPTKAMSAMARDAAGTLANLKAVSGYFAGAAGLVTAVVDAERMVGSFQDREYVATALYAGKALFDAANGGATLLTALSSSAPLIARLAGERIAWLSKATVGIAGATARATALASGSAVNPAVEVAMDTAAKQGGIVVGERAGLMLLGRAVLFLCSWEVSIGLTVVQLLIAYWADDDLQAWMEKCPFGRSSPSPPWSAGKQYDVFEKAMRAVGLQS
jgi:hypothetical protein